MPGSKHSSADGLPCHTSVHGEGNVTRNSRIPAVPVAATSTSVPVTVNRAVVAGDSNVNCQPIADGGLQSNLASMTGAAMRSPNRGQYQPDDMTSSHWPMTDTYRTDPSRSNLNVASEICATCTSGCRCMRLISLC